VTKYVGLNKVVFDGFVCELSRYNTTYMEYTKKKTDTLSQ